MRIETVKVRSFFCRTVAFIAYNIARDRRKGRGDFGLGILDFVIGDFGLGIAAKTMSRRVAQPVLRSAIVNRYFLLDSGRQAR